MEQIIQVGLFAAFILLLLHKVGLFTYLQVSQGITPCLFCWSWWICVIVMTIVQMPWYFAFILYALRQPTLMSVYGLNFLAVLFSAASSAVLTTFIVYSTTIRYGNS